MNGHIEFFSDEQNKEPQDSGFFMRKRKQPALNHTIKAALNLKP